MDAKLRLGRGLILRERHAAVNFQVFWPSLSRLGMDAHERQKSWLKAKPLLHRAARVRGTNRKWREIDE